MSLVSKFFNKYTFAFFTLLVAMLLVLKNSEYAFVLSSASYLLFFLLCWKESAKLKNILLVHFPQQNKFSLPVPDALQQQIIAQEKESNELIVEIEKISSGEWNTESVIKDSVAGQAISKLKSSLSSLRNEEEKRGWAARGLATITAIRNENKGVDEYAYAIISVLIKFLDASQGAFYQLHAESESPFLQQLATYAYGKQMTTDGPVRIDIGTGMVGQCAQEKEIILIDQVPAGYLKIASGLGDSSPQSIVIAPLIFRDQVFGVIELASFHSFESYQVEFIRKVCENIAAELLGIVTHENTSRLLADSLQQANELKSQEEELRQNMEEMHATQEQMRRREEEASQHLKEVEDERRKNIAILNGCMDGVITFNEQGVVEFVNVAAQEIFGKSESVLLKQNIRDVLDINIVIHPAGESKIMAGKGNEINVRTEVSANDGDLSLLLTVVKTQLNEQQLFTLFIQKISVDLF